MLPAPAVITNNKASVYVAGAKEPCLSVNVLNDRKKGRAGLKVGNNSSGDFANLVIVPGV
jgi:hypothetical protein